MSSGYEGDALNGDSFAYPPAVQNTLGTFYDPRLFDVSYLEANGYDDQARTDIPVIVQFANQDLADQAVRRGTIEGGIHVTNAFEYGPYAMGYVSKHGPFVSPTAANSLLMQETIAVSGDGFAPNSSVQVVFNAPYGPDGSPSVSTISSVQYPGSVTIQTVTDSTGTLVSPVYNDGVVGIYLDGVVHETPDATGIAPTLDTSLPLIGAPEARKAGLTGKGVRIAVVDTGIDASHPDLAGRVVADKNFSSDKDTLDHFGHGTHVAGIAAGTGAASDGKYGGVAPQALLINAKALSRSGSGTESGIMRAMDWAADQGARVINMSLGGGQSDGTDPISREVNAITLKKNVLFVIAAGNSGPTRKVSTPAAADSSLAVGAVDKTPAMAAFSSRGPRIKDMALKPDIVAPGVSITAPRANHGDGNPYATYSGTSMATPMVAGSAALVFQLHPKWTAMQVKAALMSSASPLGAATAEDGFVSAYDQGAGLVDLRGIVKQAAMANPASLSFNVLAPDQRADQAFAVDNLSGSQLELGVRGSLHGPDGNVDGLDLGDAQITLPPNGSVQLRVGIRAPSTAGQYTGDIVFFDQATNKQVAREVVAFVVTKGS